MINIPPIKSSAPVKAEILADVTKTWRIGQLLNATTQQGGDALSKVLIQVGKHTLEAKTPVALQTGEEIKLLVKATSGRLPTLSIINPQTGESSPSSHSAIDPKLITSKLRQFIAVQQSFSQLQQLSQSVLNNSSHQIKLPEPIRAGLVNVQNTLNINNKNLSSSQLKQYILNSGVFFESRLVKQLSTLKPQQKIDNIFNNDFKYQLLTIKAELNKFNPTVKSQNLIPETLTPKALIQLQADILKTGNKPAEIINKLFSTLPRPLITQLTGLLTSPVTQTPATEDIKLLAQTISQITQNTQSTSQKNLITQLHSRLMLLDLAQQVDQSINKITSLQLQPLSREADGLVLLLFNLVFKDSHEHFDLNFRIQEDDDSSTSENESWKITLNFNFKTLGLVQSKIHLIDNQVSTVFHTEHFSTAEKILPLLPLLKTGFKQAGLEVLNLDVIKGLVEDKPVTSSRINLLDEQV